ncbi:MAG: AAA family ATPase [Leptospiraceae bacterium]|nr:AAA family ATPase [Leptospiraceae bacterium]
MLEIDCNESCERTLIQRLKNFYRQRERNPNKVLILVQPVKVLPPELEKEIALLDLPLPNKADIQVILENVCEDKKISLPKDEELKDKVLSAALGLTIMECDFAYRKAIEKHGAITEASIPTIIQEKEAIIKKSGILEYFHPQENMENVGGLDILKNWLKKRGKAFGKGASDFGLDTPKGILLLGIPGTGKSLSAKAIANEWQLPLLRLDIGKVYAGIVGASEENMRNALKQAEALAPCILWVDEIEKGLAGTQSSGLSDGGTGSRVFGTFLTWMQEKTKPVFVVATANDISQLPPELLRKGRVDEIFFVDLPSKEARKEIFSICLKRKKRDPKDFDLEKLALESKGFREQKLKRQSKKEFLLLSIKVSF